MWLFYYILISFLAFHKKPGILHFIESLKNICFHLQSSKTIYIFVKSNFRGSSLTFYVKVLVIISIKKVYL